MRVTVETNTERAVRLGAIAVLAVLFAVPIILIAPVILSFIAIFYAFYRLVCWAGWQHREHSMGPIFGIENRLVLWLICVGLAWFFFKLQTWIGIP